MSKKPFQGIYKAQTPLFHSRVFNSSESGPRHPSRLSVIERCPGSLLFWSTGKDSKVCALRLCSALRRAAEDRLQGGEQDEDRAAVRVGRAPSSQPGWSPGSLQAAAISMARMWVLGHVSYTHRVPALVQKTMQPFW